ncbi:MAG TPA: mannitol dehydrogenase family protein [Microlunatus sp.]
MTTSPTDTGSAPTRNAASSYADQVPVLNRSLAGTRPAAPVRIVHLGLGNFHRAHQAWYTAHADDAADWGIAAFTGRRPDAAADLAPQDGLYTLITRSATEDRFEIIEAISAVHASTEHDRLLDYFRRPEVAVVTITVTEAAYLRGPDGHLDLHHPGVDSDLKTLQTDLTAPVATLPARLAAGLAARRDADAGPITILSCDNLPHNGAVAAAVVTDLAAELDPDLRDWIATEVDFATSMVDRITPATTDDDRSLVATELHYRDSSPVPTEPYTEWVMSGRFPAGRPAWQTAGATIVDDVTAYEQRKLTLLNGAHSLLAYTGSVRGHTTIDEAMGDVVCRDRVEAFWDEACPHLTLPQAELVDYREALTDRFTNPRVRHQLSQIAADGSIKLPVRVVPSLLAERSAGRLPIGGATAVAAWIWHLRGRSVPVNDPGATAARTAAAGADASRDVLTVLDPRLGSDPDLVDLVNTQLDLLDPGPDHTA